ncbi:uncharacterized protein N7469_004098 [Penicillium citrinum]|uniref:Uncharacterized protein n=1 Tax=Penicillium citrinum TaxID=5077 RepID=A0A9W9P4E6_PENCI|nr:uncharacterized protein N7469_004098 [Penicillium citrinum]KAJ5234930.1 hypothetical protein N7469_004098 [Penicillium citrinum]
MYSVLHGAFETSAGDPPWKRLIDSPGAFETGSRLKEFHLENDVLSDASRVERSAERLFSYLFGALQANVWKDV